MRSRTWIWSFVLLGLFSVKETMLCSFYLCLKAVGLWRGFSEILSVRIYLVGGGVNFSTWFIMFLLLIAKLIYGLRQKAELVMLKTGKNWRTCSGHVYIYLKQLVGEGMRCGGLCFSRVLSSPHPSRLPGARQHGAKRDSKKGKVPGSGCGRARAGRPVLGVGGAAVGGSGRAGKMALSGALPAFVAQFALTLLPHGRHFKALSAAAAPRWGRFSFCLGNREILSPKPQKLLAFFLPAWVFWQGPIGVVWPSQASPISRGPVRC